MILSNSFFNRFGWNLDFCIDFLIWRTSCSIHLARGNPTYAILSKRCDIGLHLDINGPISFRFRVIIETTKLHFDTSLDDLELHLRSQLYGKSNTFALFWVLSFCTSIMNKGYALVTVELPWSFRRKRKYANPGERRAGGGGSERVLTLWVLYGSM